ALGKSGALTILKQFIKHASLDHRYHYFCFIPKGLNLQKSNNVSFVEVSKLGWFKRILWDSYFFEKQLKTHGVNPVKIISLQNTSINSDKEQIIYLHQPLPFSSVRWSFLKKEQFKLFLYKHFYKFFILLYVRNNTVFVVQTNWMKSALCSTSNINENRVHVIKPDIELPNVVPDDNPKKTASIHHTLLYPATPLFYKNHQIILDSLKIIKARNEISNIKFQVTFKPEEYKSFSESVNQYGLNDNVDYLGTIPYGELIQKYQSASMVLFPSYVETFGLPLAEGATLRKPVLCSDFPFSRDVLNGYPGATYLDYKDPLAWADAITNTLNKIKCDSLHNGDFTFKPSSSWKDFFKLI
ncbi:glycosyltransferase, partial [Shewanella sp. MBTL60-112-B2]|uniref:glycosyltransferase n=1 Tax=Shewanella sp. MBTL60-112-B2 TaxID=2815917 RepID=UPI001C7FA641